MIFRRLALALAGAAALATSAGVFVAALAFGLYAVVEPELGRPGAAAAVAAAAAVFIALAAVGIRLAGGAKRPKPTKVAVRNAVERALDLVRDQPVVAISAALAAGFLAIRNPRYLGAAIRAFVEGRPIPK